ncbi:hypothetical protein KM043_010864 [Ampulex compressa]|nr:hypothetical protein KM043_010864 [Ampulex compressa]
MLVTTDKNRVRPGGPSGEHLVIPGRAVPQEPVVPSSPRSHFRKCSLLRSNNIAWPALLSRYWSVGIGCGQEASRLEEIKFETEQKSRGNKKGGSSKRSACFRDAIVIAE